MPQTVYMILIRVQLEVGKEYYYCTCGLSKNQPFCDGSHKGTSFTPMKFKAEKADNWLCQCKRSKNIPYCDGTHKTLEFWDELDR
jgi:CDGSH-type Zn-finger protein